MKNKKKIILIVVISLVLALLLSAGGFFTYKYFELKNSKDETKTELPNKQDQDENTNNENSEQENQQTTEQNQEEDDKNEVIAAGFIKDNQIVGENGQSFHYNNYRFEEDAEQITAILIKDFNLNGKKQDLKITENYIKLGNNKMSYSTSAKNYGYQFLGKFTPYFIYTYKNYFLIKFSVGSDYSEYLLFTDKMNTGNLYRSGSAPEVSFIVDVEEFNKGKIKATQYITQTSEGKKYLNASYETIDLTNGIKSTKENELLSCEEVQKDKEHRGYCNCNPNDCQWT